jgi:hypothetical protein
MKQTEIEKTLQTCGSLENELMVKKYTSRSRNTNQGQKEYVFPFTRQNGPLNMPLSQKTLE